MNPARTVRLKLNALLVPVIAAFLLAGCQTAELGGEMVEVREGDQPLVFSAPGLEGGYRSFKYGDPRGGNNEVVIATYGPKSGALPRASIYFIALRGGQHFIGRDSVIKEMSHWHYHKDRTLAETSSGRAVNELGAVEYSVFDSGGDSCLGFLQFFGKLTDAGYGTDRITGYYCAPEGVTLTDADAKSILKRLGHRTKGMPEG